MSSAQQLDVPLLAAARSGSVESITRSVIELPPVSGLPAPPASWTASGIPAELKRRLVPALTGLLADPSMVDQVTGVARRDGERLTTALRCSEANADLVVWRFLLKAFQVPGAVLTWDGLELVRPHALYYRPAGDSDRCGAGMARRAAPGRPGWVW